jgi:endonuclease YncB( thermonuclease family)
MSPRITMPSLFAGLILCLCLEGTAEAVDSPEVPTTGKVVKVYDGDTLTLASGDKVRLRGVNTPEIRPYEAFSTEARDAAAKVFLHQDVVLRYGAGDKKDGYGRLIASISVDETDLGMLLVEKGLGHVFHIPPDNLDIEPLLQAQAKAKAAKLGIWSDPRYAHEIHITSFHANGRGEDEVFVNGEYFRICNISDQPVNLDGYAVINLAGQRYNFPPAVLLPGYTAKVHSGKGKSRTEPDVQMELYLGSEGPIFDNKRDRLTLLNKDAEVVDTREHKVN